MTKLPPLNALRYFLVAAKFLSFKKASEELFVTQAAISQHIKTLESYLGVPLFVRHTRQIELTDDGKKLLPYIQAGFENFITGVGLLGEDTAPNVLNITVVESLSSRWLVPRLQSFQDEHPNIRVRWEPENKIRQFEGTDLDLAIRFGEGSYAGLESRFLLDDEYVLVCHPSLVTANTKPEDLYSLALLAERGPVTGAAWSAFLAKYNLENKRFNKLLEVDDSTVTIIEAALAGQGVAMLRYKLIYQQIKRNQLVQLFEFRYPSAYSYFLVAPAHYFKRTKVQKFEAWLRCALLEIT